MVGFSNLNKRNTYINELFDFAGQNDFQFFGLYEVYNKRINEENNPKYLIYKYSSCKFLVIESII